MTRSLNPRADDYQRCGLSDDERNVRDVARARQSAEYPWVKDRKPWQQEIRKLLANGFKMQVESLITKDISSVTDVDTPPAPQGRRLPGVIRRQLSRWRRRARAPPTRPA